MALVESAYTIQITMQDSDGNRSPFTTYIGGNELFTVAEARANTLQGLLGTISGCEVVESSITKRFTETGTLVFQTGAEVEDKGKFSFTLNDTRVHSVTVPGLKEQYVYPDTNQINRADADIAALIALLIAGGTDAVGHTIVKIKDAVEISTRGPKRR